MNKRVNNDLKLKINRKMFVSLLHHFGYKDIEQFISKTRWFDDKETVRKQLTGNEILTPKTYITLADSLGKEVSEVVIGDKENTMFYKEDTSEILIKIAMKVFEEEYEIKEEVL